MDLTEAERKFAALLDEKLAPMIEAIRVQARDEGYLAGREDAARDIEDAMDAARGTIRRGALRAAVRLARAGQHPRTPREDVTP